MPPATLSIGMGHDAAKRSEAIGRSASPSTPFSLTLDSEGELTSDSQTPSVSGDDANMWTVHDSEALYSLNGWGSPYFSINGSGHLCVHPKGGRIYDCAELQCFLRHQPYELHWKASADNFLTNDKGRATKYDAGRYKIDLYDLLRSLQEQGMQTPCLFRFPDIVNDRIQKLQSCFDNARARYKYKVRLSQTQSYDLLHHCDLACHILQSNSE